MGARARVVVSRIRVREITESGALNDQLIAFVRVFELVHGTARRGVLIHAPHVCRQATELITVSWHECAVVYKWRRPARHVAEVVLAVHLPVCM